jgi:hypothetical protein
MSRKITIEVSENGISRDKLLEFLKILRNQATDLPKSAQCDLGIKVEVVEP